MTHPFEVVKIRYDLILHLGGRWEADEFTRLQLQGELQTKKDAPKLYRGVLHGIGIIAKNEGARGLFRGIGSAVRRTSRLHTKDDC